MHRFLPSALLVSLLVSAGPALAQADGWAPPDRRMPGMPTSAELAGDWLGQRAPWFRGLETAAGVSASELRATGEPRGSAVAHVARFHHGPLPVAVWSDRNGDGRADLIEIYRGGGLIVQLIDADYDGNANLLRRYDGSGRLLGEQRM